MLTSVWLVVSIGGEPSGAGAVSGGRGWLYLCTMTGCVAVGWLYGLLRYGLGCGD